MLFLDKKSMKFKISSIIFFSFLIFSSCEQQKDKLINEVININEQSKIFDCLSICNSYEMGFVLPLTDKIKNLVRFISSFEI